MNTKFRVTETLLVVTRQPSPEERKERRLGILARDIYHGRDLPYFTVLETASFLDEKDNSCRAQVAQAILDTWKRESLRFVLVLVHKADHRFVFAQLGLIDELLKLLPRDVYIGTNQPIGGSITSEIFNVIAAQRLALAKFPMMRTPLLDDYSELVFTPLGEFLKAFADEATSEEKGAARNE